MRRGLSTVFGMTTELDPTKASNAMVEMLKLQIFTHLVSG